MSDKPEEYGWTCWQPPSLLKEVCMTSSTVTSQTGEDVGAEPSLEADRLAMLQQAEKQGFDQGEKQGFEHGEQRGFEQGRQAGYEAGKLIGQQEAMIAEQHRQSVEQTEYIERLRSLFQQVQQALDSLDHILPSRLIQLALSAVHGLVGHPYLNEALHKSLHLRISQLLAEEPLLNNKIQLWVSRHDETLMTDLFSETLALRGWRLCIDDDMLQGGCRLTSDEGEMDECIETRWNMLCSLLREESLS